MEIYIRVDASLEIGTGHVMRCLTLANRLSEHDANVSFICREHKGHLMNIIEENGYKVFKLPTPQKFENLPNSPQHGHLLGVPMVIDAEQTSEIVKDGPVDLLIIDHYGIDEEWEKILRTKTSKIMVIDDLADRVHDCDFLLDQNYFDHSPFRYRSLVPSHCKAFFGPGYALLREAFFEKAIEKRQRGGTVKRIFIFFGGNDPTNETEKAIAAFLHLQRHDIDADIVVGQNNPHIRKLISICQKYDNLHFHCQASNMEELMAHADVAIGAGGATTWERCILGLPSIVISVAENQEEICESLAKKYVIKYLGKKEDVDLEMVTNQLKSLLDNEMERSEISRRSLLLMKDSLKNQEIMVKEIMS